MRRKHKQARLLTSIALFAAGFTALLRPGFGRGIFALVIAAAGCAFIMLYRERKTAWALALGAYLAYTGVAGLIGRHIGGYFSASFVAAMFFIVPSIIIITMCFEHNRKTPLAPACLSLWLGVFILLKGIHAFRGHTVMVFFICMTFASLTLFILERRKYGKLALIAACGAATCGLLLFDGLRLAVLAYKNLSVIVPLLIIGCAAAVLLFTVKT